MRKTFLTPTGLALLLSSQAVAQPPGQHGPGMMRDGWWFSPMLGPLWLLIFIILAVVLVVLVIRWLNSSALSDQELHPSGGQTPLEILKERYARGEIDKEEFEERRRLLKDE